MFRGMAQVSSKSNNELCVNKDDPPTIQNDIQWESVDRNKEQQPQHQICVVCMDHKMDAKLSPCGHDDVCLSCLGHTALAKCPICRASIERVTNLTTGKRVQISFEKPLSLRDRSPSRPTNSVLIRPMQFSRAHNFYISSLSPTIRPVPNHPYSAFSHMSSPNAHPPVVQQASPSVRSVPASDVAAFANLRRTGSTLSGADSCTASVRDSVRGSDAGVNPPPSRNRSSSASLADSAESLILLGPNRKMLIPLARRLMAAFPPPNRRTFDEHEDQDSPSRNTIFLDGQLLKIVLLEAPPYSMRLQLASRIELLFPRLILLCADFHNVATFEVAVRLDMDVLDYMGFPVVWVLLRAQTTNVPFPFSALVRKRTNSHSIEEADIRVARHFLSSPRPVVAITVDGRRSSSSVRKSMTQVMASCSKTRTSRHVRRRTSIVSYGGIENSNSSGHVEINEAHPSPIPRANSLRSIARLITTPCKKLRPSFRTSLQLTHCLRDQPFQDD